MPNSLLFLILGFSVLSALFALFAFWRGGGRQGNILSRDDLTEAVRSESDRIRTDAADQARGLRQEVADNIRGFQTATLQAFGELGRQLGDQIKDFSGELDTGLKAEGAQFEGFAKRLTDSLGANESLLHRSLADMSAAGEARQRAIVQTLDAKSTELANASSEAGRTLRTELSQSFQRLATSLNETAAQLGAHQKERLDGVTQAIESLTEIHSKAQDALRATVEGRLDAIRSESATKLEEMRQTVDDKLQSTLEKRLGESFKIVSNQLERVHQGLGEMQSLAAGVGDLKRVLSNVKVRGTWGELQLGNLLEQFLAPEQFMRDVQVKEDSQERVEFAIRLPGRSDDKEVLLPIDAKFPQEDFERLVVAAENSDAVGVEAAASALEARVKACARTISEKYINPPQTTDIAILFLPTESLYAEVLRRPGLFEHIQREYHVTLAGPTTLTAILNALQMGFRSLAIEKRTSEVWQVLGAIRSEFNRYGEVVDRLRRQLNTAVNTIDSLGIRTRAMSRKLRDVEILPDGTAHEVLGLDQPDAISESGEEESETARHLVEEQW